MNDSPTPEPHLDGPRMERLRVAFEMLLDTPLAERESALARLEAGDPELAAEVSSLLAAHAASTGFLDSPASASRPGPAPGDALGPYRIVEEIGRGGIGVVYRATRDDDAFRKDVAIKLIDPGMRSDEMLRRFRAERQILAMLEHPNIARLLDGGTAPDGSPFLVMEYVEGQPLITWCDEHRLGIRERLQLFLVVCDAVRFAHQRLVVHRDLKPDNVLVTPDGSPRLLDFGIAKLLASEGSLPSTMTMPAHRLLTPDYASPEQVRGEPVTVSTDVYSLGVVLYELLVGERPHRFTTRSPEEVLRVVTQLDPPRPSVAVSRADDEEAMRARGSTARALARRLAGDLDYVVLKAIERDAGRRYATVDQLAQDIRRFLDGEAVLARGGSRFYLFARFVRRHRAAAAVSAIVLVSLLAGVIGTSWQAGVARRERDRATRRFDDVRRLAHAVMFDLHDAIANLPGSTRARELLVRHALGYLEDLRREADPDPGLRHEMGVAYAKIADVQGRPEFPNLGQTRAAKENYEQAIRLLDEALAAAPESTAIARDRVVVTQRYADLLGAMGRHDEALRQALWARTRIEAELARRPGDVEWQGDLCVASDHLIDLQLAVADTAAAMAECWTNLRLATPAPGAPFRNSESRRGLLIAQAKTANVLAMRGERDSAVAYFVASEALAREAVADLPENTDARRDLSIIYSMHGMFLSERGEIDSALIAYGHAVEITTALAAADTANALNQLDVADADFQLGTILARGGRHAQAEQRFARAYQRFGRIVAADPVNIDVRTRMARCARSAGESCRALSRAGTSPRASLWFTRSLADYRVLQSAGALAGEDARAPRELERVLAQLGAGAAR